MENLTETEKMRRKFAHIPGWGVDADSENEPTYPMKNYTGEDHQRLDYKRPTLQKKTVEVLESTEHLRTPATFGTVEPPSGLSGVIRRFAFRYSESMLRHWMALLLADRVNVVEGVLDDLRHGKVPNVIKERGIDAMWEHDKKLLMRRAAVRGAIYGAVIGLVVFALVRKNREHEEEYEEELEEELLGI